MERREVVTSVDQSMNGDQMKEFLVSESFGYIYVQVP